MASLYSGLLDLEVVEQTCAEGAGLGIVEGDVGGISEQGLTEQGGHAPSRSVMFIDK